MDFLKKIIVFFKKRIYYRPYTQDKYLLDKKNMSLCHNFRCSLIPYLIFFLFTVVSLFSHYHYEWDHLYGYRGSFGEWLQNEHSAKFILDTIIRFSKLSFIYYITLFWYETHLSNKVFKYRLLVLQEPIEELSDNDKIIDPKILKLRLTRIKKWRKLWIVYVFIIVLCSIFVYQFSNHGTYTEFFHYVSVGEETLGSFLADYIPNVLVYAAPLVILYALVLFIIELSLENRLNSINNDIVSDADGELVSQDIYSNSIKMSYKYLNQYYAQTRKQAENGFRITCIVAICGGLIIFGGIIAMFLGNTEPAYLTTATGVIIEFIASIFFYLYNKTMQNMGDYHNKLVLSQNIAIALEVVDDIEGDDKNKIKAEMVKELLKDINTHINENKPERKSDAIEHTKPELPANADVNN